MHTSCQSLIIYMCVALLSVQWSGLHLHVDLDAHDSTPHISNLHGFDTDKHDHEADVDVQLFDLSSSWYKLIQFFILATLVLFVASIFTRANLPPPSKHYCYHRYHFLRPILRAPPLSH
jgi:hypothetical protein